MIGTPVTPAPPGVSAQVQEFAVEKRLDRYLGAIIELARRAFPSAPLRVSLGQDAEDERHRYVALDVEADGLRADELLAGQRAWSSEIARVCPSHLTVCFVLGWR